MAISAQDWVREQRMIALEAPVGGVVPPILVSNEMYAALQELQEIQNNRLDIYTSCHEIVFRSVPVVCANSLAKLTPAVS